MKIKSLPRTLIVLIIIGLILRIVFILFVAEKYFGRENIYVDGDTWNWLDSFINLIERGCYTADPTNEYGYFYRMPGYSFFTGIIYYIFGKNTALAFPFIAWLQTILDVINIYLIFRISLRLFNSKRAGYIAAFLYATYPFVIVWTPVVYSESISIFFMFMSVFYFTGNRRYRFYFAGLFISLAILNRPQTALFLPVLFLIIIIQHRKTLKLLVKYAVQLGVVIAIVYGAWPIRNYINHDKIILTQDLRGVNCWDIDVISFMQYIYSVKAEWEPQFSNILHDKNVEFPDIAYSIEGDSVKLERAVYLAKNCGSGFSHWGYFGYWKEPITGENCNEEIASLFNELRESQIKNNPVSFYLTIPIQNLKKALFKTQLYDQATPMRKLAANLFYYRILLNILAIIGCLYLLLKRKPYSMLFLFSFLVYFMLCFGTSVQFRNIEMRYFIHADLIFLIPAAYIINLILSKIRPEKNGIS